MTLPLYPRAILPPDEPLLPQTRGVWTEGVLKVMTVLQQESPVHIRGHRPRRARGENEARISSTMPAALANIIWLTSIINLFDR